MFGSLALFTKRKDYELDVTFSSDDAKACIGFIKIPASEFDEDLSDAPVRAVFLNNSAFRGSSYSTRGGTYLYPHFSPLCANFVRVCNGFVYVPYIVFNTRAFYERDLSKTYKLPFSVFYHNVFFDRESYEKVLITELKEAYLPSWYDEYGFIFAPANIEDIGRNLRPDYVLDILPACALIVEKKECAAYIFDSVLDHASPGVLIEIVRLSSDGKWHVRFWKSRKVFDARSDFSLLYDCILPDNYTHVSFSFGMFNNLFYFSVDTIGAFTHDVRDIFAQDAILGLTYDESFFPILDYFTFPLPGLYGSGSDLSLIPTDNTIFACNLSLGESKSFSFASLSCFSLSGKKVSCIPSSGSFIEVEGGDLSSLAKEFKVPESRIFKVRVLNPADFGRFSPVKKHPIVPFRTGLIPLPTKFLSDAGLCSSDEIVVVIDFNNKRYKTRGYKLDLSPVDGFFGYNFYLISLPNERDLDVSSGSLECIVIIDGNYDRIEGIEIPKAQAIMDVDLTDKEYRSNEYVYNYLDADIDINNPGVSDDTSSALIESFDIPVHIDYETYRRGHFSQSLIDSFFYTKTFFKLRDEDGPPWMEIRSIFYISRSLTPKFWIYPELQIGSYCSVDRSSAILSLYHMNRIPSYYYAFGHKKLFFVFDLFKRGAPGVDVCLSVGFDRFFSLWNDTWGRNFDSNFSGIPPNPHLFHMFCMGRFVWDPLWETWTNTFRFPYPRWPLDVAGVTFIWGQFFQFFTTQGIKESYPFPLRQGDSITDTDKVAWYLFDILPRYVTFKKGWWYLLLLRAYDMWQHLWHDQQSKIYRCNFLRSQSLLTNPELRTFHSYVRLIDHFYPLKKAFIFQDFFAFREVEFWPFVYYGKGSGIRHTGYYFDLSSYLKYIVHNKHIVDIVDVEVKSPLKFGDLIVDLVPADSSVIREEPIYSGVYNYLSVLGTIELDFDFQLDARQLAAIQLIARYFRYSSLSRFLYNIKFLFYPEWKSISNVHYLNIIKELISFLFSIRKDDIVSVDVALVPPLSDQTNPNLHQGGLVIPGGIPRDIFLKKFRISIGFDVYFRCRTTSREIIFNTPFLTGIVRDSFNNRNLFVHMYITPQNKIQLNVYIQSPYIDIRQYIGTYELDMEVLDYIYDLVSDTELDVYDVELSCSVNVIMPARISSPYYFGSVCFPNRPCLSHYALTPYLDPAEEMVLSLALKAFPNTSFYYHFGITFCNWTFVSFGGSYGRVIAAPGSTRDSGGPVVGAPVVYGIVPVRPSSSTNFPRISSNSRTFIYSVLNGNASAWCFSPDSITCGNYGYSAGLSVSGSPNKVPSAVLYHNCGNLRRLSSELYVTIPQIKASLVSKKIFGLTGVSTPKVVVGVLYRDRVFSKAIKVSGVVESECSFSIKMSSKEYGFLKRFLNIWSMVRQSNAETQSDNLVYEDELFGYSGNIAQETLVFSSNVFSVCMTKGLVSWELILYNKFESAVRSEITEKLLVLEI